MHYKEATASLSPCKRYRYRLTRLWDYDKPGVLFILLNPSTADGRQDDPTVRRCVGFAREWGAGRLWIINLFALRATNPRELLADPADAVGPHNDDCIYQALRCFDDRADLIVCGWGNWGSHKLLRPRRDDVLRMLPVETNCLAITSTGDPKHPLYCKSALGPVSYEFPTSTGDFTCAGGECEEL